LVLLGVGIALLIFLSLIPLFSLITVSASIKGTVMGQSINQSQSASSPSLFSDNWHGKVILIVGIVVSLLAIAALVIYLVAPSRTADLFLTIAGCTAGGWGILTLLWLGGWIWKILHASGAFKERFDVEMTRMRVAMRGMGGQIDASVSINPGIGMWIGLGVALAVAVIFSTLMSMRGKKLWLYIGEGAGLLLGALLVVVAVQPWKVEGLNAPPTPGAPRMPNRGPFGMHHAAPASSGTAAPIPRSVPERT
jgi:hypothetical protein